MPCSRSHHPIDLRQPPRWGEFTVRDEYVARFRAILERHLGSPLPWADDDLTEMINSGVRLMRLLIESQATGRGVDSAKGGETIDTS